LSQGTYKRNGKRKLLFQLVRTCIFQQSKPMGMNACSLAQKKPPRCVPSVVGIGGGRVGGVPFASRCMEG